MRARGEKSTLSGTTKLLSSVLIGWADALSTVPWGGRAIACMFPRRLLDSLHPSLGVGGADMEGRKRQMRQTGSVLRGRLPALRWCSPNQNLRLPLAGKGQGLVQAVGNTEDGVHGQGVQEQ